MRRWLTSSCSAIYLVIGLGLVACGPKDGGDDNGNGGNDDVDAGDDGAGDDDAGSTRPDARPRFDAATPATLTGKVWAPNLTSDIPIFGALVYASVNKPAAIPQEVFCEPCVETPPGGTYSSHDGSFTLNVDPGTYWLVIQKGQFRVERQITVTADQDLALPPQDTTLPSEHRPDDGAWVPRVAAVMGTDDRIEDVLGKLGFGTVVAGRFTAARGELALYDNGRANRTVPASDIAGTAAQLLGDLAAMKRFHIIFFACSTQELSMTPAVRRNVREYVNAGGKIYATDWSGEVLDQAFPPQIEFHSYADARGTADTVGTYDPIALTDTITRSGTANGTSSSFDASDSMPTDNDLKMWLGLQTSAVPDGGSEVINVSTGFETVHHYNRLNSLTPVTVGTDNQGPIVNTPKVWLEGSARGGGARKYPFAVTFEPTGCGRVLYSTFETSKEQHLSLYPQERVLLYLIMEIGVCNTTIPPVD